MPKILLGLGATCLLVAAVIFLAVAWSWLGVGGRTAVLVGLTVTTALAGQWLARRDLGVAAEALTTVALGLVVLDVFGAENAGWLGTPTDDAFLAIARHHAPRRLAGALRPGRRLFAPQVAAPLGLGIAVLGLGASRSRPGRGDDRRALLHGARAAGPGARRPWCCRGPRRPAPGWRSWP